MSRLSTLGLLTALLGSAFHRSTAAPTMPVSEDSPIGEVVSVPNRFDAERLQEAQDRRDRKAAKREAQARRVKGSPFSL